MRIKTTNKLSLEDIPKDNRDWMGKVITPINDFLTQAIKILNDGLTFPDNFIGQDYVFDFKYQTDAISFPIAFYWKSGNNPKCLQIAEATENNNAVNLAASWQFNQKHQVEIVHVVKFTTVPAVSLLTQGAKYKIRVRVTP